MSIRLLSLLWAWCLSGVLPAAVALQEPGRTLPDAALDQAWLERPDLAEDHWPIGFAWPVGLLDRWMPDGEEAWARKTRRRLEKAKQTDKAHVLAWVPATAPIRAVMLIPANSDSKHVGEHPPLRQVAERHALAIVYLRFFPGHLLEGATDATVPGRALAAALTLVGIQAERPELVHVPWVVLGKSSRGRFPIRAAWWFPRRIVATISYHAETLTWPMAEWSRLGDETILHLAINGLTEWSGTWYRHVRPSLLNYQHHTGVLAQQLVLYGVGHGNYVDLHGSANYGLPQVNGKVVRTHQVWDYLARFVDDALRLRLPAEADPTTGPVALLRVDRAAGWALHPRLPEEAMGLKWFPLRGQPGAHETVPWPDEPSPVYAREQGVVDPSLLVRPVAEVNQDERARCFWVPGQDAARAWLQLHNLYGFDQKLLPNQSDNGVRR